MADGARRQHRPRRRRAPRGPIALALAGSLAVGCVTWFDRIDYFHMAPRLEYHGFSFDRPPSPHWYLLQSEQSYTDVTLRRDFVEPSDTHTFFARVGLSRLPAEPGSHEEFAELARPSEQKAPYEIREVSRREELATRQGQWCIRFESEHEVRGAPPAPTEALALVMRGFRCLHPAFPATSLDFYYSERGLPDEIDPDLSREGESFLESVRIDVAPGTPAARRGPVGPGRRVVSSDLR